MSDSFIPTEQQFGAIRSIKEWYEAKRGRQVYYLAGYAGTGKTTMIPAVMDALGLDPDRVHDVMFGAYTGKAALVMRKKGLTGATTIHRMIYKPVEDAQGKLHFVLNHESIVQDTRLVVLDECSMIDGQMAKDLLAFGTKILVIGDPGQLPPVRGHGVFTGQRPDYFLEEIHRHAAESPIIRLATMARLGQPIPFGDFGHNVMKVHPDDGLTIADLTEFDQVITGMNVTRRKLNTEMKNHRGFPGKYPLVEGIKLICLKNQHDLGLLNGMMFNTLGQGELHGNKYFTQSVMDDETVHEELDIFVGHFDAYEVKIDLGGVRTGGLSEFDYGYAATCHKVQGSSYPQILIYDDGFGRRDGAVRRAWLYTALTRAEEGLVLVSEYDN